MKRKRVVTKRVEKETREMEGRGVDGDREVQEEREGEV